MYYLHQNPGKWFSDSRLSCKSVPHVIWTQLNKKIAHLHFPFPAPYFQARFDVDDKYSSLQKFTYLYKSIMLRVWEIGNCYKSTTSNLCKKRGIGKIRDRALISHEL